MADDRPSAAGPRSRRGILMGVAALVLVAAGFAFSRQFTAAPAAPSPAAPATRSPDAPAPEAAAPAPRAPEAAGPAAPAADAVRPDAAQGSTSEDCEEEPPPTSFTLAECDSGAETPAERPSSPPASP